MHRLFLTAAAAVLLAAPARAQEAPADTTAGDPTYGPRKGAWSLSFTAPGYALGERVELGVWEMVGARTNLGLTLEVAVYGGERDGDGGGDQDLANTSVGLGLNARRYLAMSRPVMPYLQGRVFGRGSYSRREGDGPAKDVNRVATAGVEGVLGAEWFPVRHVSLSGHTGLRFSRTTQDQEVQDPQGNEYEVSTREMGFQTFTSALALQIYF
jgi:hypothetical protein